MTSVVICDPPSPLRRLLAQRVENVAGIDRVETVDGVAALAELLDRQQPDIVLLASQPVDAGAPATIRLIKHRAPLAQVVLLTMGTDPDEVVAGMAAGAVGYLARDAALPEAAAALAILPLARPGAELHPAQRPRAAQPPAPRQAAGAVGLTDRELQVLQGMSRGLSNSEIGEDLFLSEDTIKTHARRLFRKMQVRDRAHAVAEGFRKGLLH